MPRRMILKSTFSILFLISAACGCAEIDCEYSSKLDWKQWNPNVFDRHLLAGPLREKVQDENVSKLMERFKSKRVQDHLSSDLGFESFRNNPELSRNLLQQIIQNVQRSHDFPPRPNRADSKENFHLQASYIPRLG